jgi:hypothetical protein
MESGFTFSLGTVLSIIAPPQFPQNFAGLAIAGLEQLFEHVRSCRELLTGVGGMTRYGPR